MKTTVAVGLFTYNKEKYILENLFNSLIDLDPDEIRILDTTTPHDPEFRKWLQTQVEKRGLTKNTKIIKEKNDGNFSRWRNNIIKSISSEWMIFLDSDEMLSIEMAKGLKQKLSELPEESLALRIRKIDLLDDEHMLKENIWNGRPPITVHPAIVKTGFGRCDENRPRHGSYDYPGRITIPFNSPEHPKKDWDGFYMIHLWLYKDNPEKRWDISKWEIKKEDDGIQVSNGFSIARERGWTPIKIPKGIASWRKIVWQENS